MCLVLHLLCLSIGCLAPDPIQSPQSIRENTATAQIASITKAPQSIELDILQKRSFNEAPLLASRVKQGALVSISNRLPDRTIRRYNQARAHWRYRAMDWHF